MSITVTDTTAPVQVGTIHVASWGYDQTNVDFYEVTSSTAKTVALRPISQHRSAEVSFMSEHVTPKLGEYTGGAFRRKVHPGGAVINNSCSNAYPWDGRQMTQSHYA